MLALIDAIKIYNDIVVGAETSKWYCHQQLLPACFCAYQVSLQHEWLFRYYERVLYEYEKNFIFPIPSVPRKVLNFKMNAVYSLITCIMP